MTKTYKFYGWESAKVPAVTDIYEGIETPLDLYDALSEIWCADTCAPRMREKWSKENMTLGQCSITAFLVQDIFGGRVFGIPREGGKNFHCFNVIGDCVFDLTSEQFGSEKLDYTLTASQLAENGVHRAGRTDAPACGGVPETDGRKDGVFNPEQFREVHFSKEEKRLRYEYLKAELLKKCKNRRIPADDRSHGL